MIARLAYRGLRVVMPREATFWDYIARTGIVIFTGPNGSGKSLAAVASLLPVLDGDGIGWECWNADHRHHDAYRFHAADCTLCPAPGAVERLRVQEAKGFVRSFRDLFCDDGWELLDGAARGTRLAYSTVVLLDPLTGDPHHRFRALTDFRALVLIEHSDVLFDEVAGVADAQDSGSIPVQVVQWMHTLRKADVRLRVTTPAYSRCAKPVRQVAQAVVDCRSHFAERSSGRLWRSRRMFTFRAYDRAGFEDFTEGVKERVASAARCVFWRPGCRAEAHYDTLSAVQMLGHVTEHGMCSACGGSRSRPRCACDPAAEHEHVVIEETVSAAGSRVRRAVPVAVELAAERALAAGRSA